MRRLLRVHLGEKIGKDFERNGERGIRYCELLHIVLLLRELDSDLWGPRLILLLGIQKHLFYVLSKNACDLESQRQTRVVLAGFNSVDRSASDSHMGCKLGLRPFFFRTQYA